MTIKEMLKEIAPFRRISRETLYVHLRALKAKPIGVRQCPQQYPDFTAKRVLSRLGFTGKKVRQ
jgi:hypothetical protein